MAPKTFGEGQGKEEWEARWQTKRPAYAREAEPLAHPGAWPSLSPIAHEVDEADQALNRKLFAEGRGRKAAARTQPIVGSGEDQQKKAG